MQMKALQISTEAGAPPCPPLPPQKLQPSQMDWSQSS
eukprot:CAMPEP_0197698772 /NCGR_PEP_ID=MMETSP1338-20131121/119721_1 /TAXON_ID=43686 ORGANISM="Pelagodinium beii, Strain RCC1491" /NCGR_SAMPLE_ID=MMETSP1338 /ASSEMBLY_ACC=CAM_ASM_000754 /LENGTH=36 /DNA_ID= /DNA_START= /DNA_END= /DNA_ORIENTATION=